MKLLVHGSGFARPFLTDPPELRCGKPRELRGDEACHWSPSSVDWNALGRSSGGSTEAADIATLLVAIRAQGIDSIDELRIIGHSNGDFLALAGTITSAQVEFREAAMIGNSATFNSAKSTLRSLQNRFKSDARVVLAGCGSGGVGASLLDLFSHTVLRTVAGFKQPILYAIDGTTMGPEVRDGTGRLLGRRIDDDARITVRGKAMYSTAANSIENVFGSELVGTAVFKQNAWDLVPDSVSHEGDIFAAVRRLKQNPGAIPASEVAYKLKAEFFPDRAALAGVGFTNDVAGLRVVEDRKMRGRFTLDVGKTFAERTTPVTLEKRVRELGQALDLVQNKKAGVIAMT